MKYWLYRFTAWLIRLLPRKAAYWIGLRICDFAYCMNHRERGAVRENMRIIFEHQGIHPSQHILDGYTRKTFQYFGKYLADFIRFRAVSAEDVRQQVSIRGLEHLEAIRNSSRGAILLTAHFGNWELGGAFVAGLGIPVHAVVRPVASPSLERIFDFFRRQRGLKTIPLEHAGIGILKALRRNQTVALVGDRDFTGTGKPHLFFGRETSLPRGAAWFSLRTGAPIYMGFVARAADDSFILLMHPPIDPKVLTTEEAIQERVAAIMEDAIAHAPWQWFIFDPFWPEQPDS
jgi:lauroyl/myristoyl acyltransferase